MNVRHFGTGDRAHRTFATRVVTQTVVDVESKDRFLHQPLMYPNHTVRAVVIVNRRLLAWVPADHQHLDGVIAAHSMAPVIALLESDVRLEIGIEDLDTRKPQVQLFKCGRAGL